MSRRHRNPYTHIIRHTVDPRIFIAPALPRGWCTVGTWFVTYDLETFGMLENPEETIWAEDQAMWRRVAKTDRDVRWVVSCPAYVERGLTVERAYRDHLFEDFKQV